RELSRRIDRHAGVALELSPLADRVEALERLAERIDDAVAVVARRLGPMPREALAHGARHVAEHGREVRLDVRRHRRRRRAEEMLHDPRTAQHRRRAVRIRGHHQHAALAEQAEAPLVVELDAPEAVAEHAGYAVMP